MDAVLSEQDIFQLIFHPGLSTAKAVTNLSGRGVGMDVVKRNIEALRGAVEIESELGAGSTFRIRLPLTLAIIDGFRVSVGPLNFIAPLDMVFECMDLGTVDTHQGRQCVILRDEWLPTVRLRDLFALPAGEYDQREKVVVVQFAQQRAGIIVDELFGELQTVVKPLGALFQSLRGIGGSTILGSGDIALILDVPHLIHWAAATEQRRSRALFSAEESR